MLYAEHQTCDWIITPLETVVVQTGTGGTTTTNQRFPIVIADLLALDLGTGDSLSL